ncbi:MAG: GH116 family glycosyl-hydrolase, partial [Fibrobacter sp.]|nr:GH116 family glycosyl-hydrolase [Fibrobacter sp.]
MSLTKNSQAVLGSIFMPVVAKTDNEDAKCPLYEATFDKLNNVEFKLKAFGPVVPGDDGKDLNIQLATSPAAMFEITAKNTGSSAIDVAVALQFVNKSSTVNGLLGGSNEGKVDSKNAITYTTTEFNDLSSSNSAKNTGNAYMMVDCSDDNAEFSSGAKGDFSTKGVLSNTDGSFVGAKCKIEAGKSVKFKFVLAWWRTFVSSQDRYKSGKNDEDNYYYHNFYKNSKEAAEFCMKNFDYVRSGIVSMVDRTMASNFPDWYKDRLFNNTYPLIHNSVWTKDGRAAYWEGKYGILGTIDQGQHAAI